MTTGLKTCGFAQTRKTEITLLQKTEGGFTKFATTNWPFNYPPTPWTAKQIKEYAQQQRSQLPESPL